MCYYQGEEGAEAVDYAEEVYGEAGVVEVLV